MATIIRPEIPADAPAIAAIITAAFAPLPYSSHTEARIVAGLRAADALSVALVAEAADSLIGHVAASPVTIDGEDRGWHGLGPVAVAPAAQRSGTGTALIRATIARLAALGAAGCVVLGDPRYYARFGFVPDAALIYPSAPAAFFQVLTIAGPPARGMVAYHPAFGVT